MFSLVTNLGQNSCNLSLSPEINSPFVNASRMWKLQSFKMQFNELFVDTTKIILVCNFVCNAK